MFQKFKGTEQIITEDGTRVRKEWEGVKEDMETKTFSGLAEGDTFFAWDELKPYCRINGAWVSKPEEE